MGRARLLACAAAVLTASALPSAAGAQACAFIGSAQPFPPCIMFDTQKAVEVVEDIRQKTEELKAKKDELLGYANIERVMGSIGKRGIPSMPSVPAIAPLRAQSFVQAGAQARAKIATGAVDTAGRNEQRANTALDLRAAAGDGYSISLATKTRFADMEKDAQAISTLAQKCSVDVRSDWSINTQARSLLMRALAARREIDAAQVQLMSARVMAGPSVSMAGDLPPVPQVPEVVDAPLPEAPAWSDRLGKVANLTTYLAALITAKDMLAGFKDSIKDHQETQADYQTVLRDAQQKQAEMVAFARADGRRKGVNGDQLLAEADRVMASMDHTTWDDPSKNSVASAAARYAEKRLDGMVKGEVSNSWSGNLVARAEAFKQEAFYREFNQQAIELQNGTLAAIVSMGKDLQIDLNDPAAIDAAIKATQGSLSAVGKEIDAAPEAIRAKREEIYASTMQTAGYRPEAD